MFKILRIALFWFFIILLILFIVIYINNLVKNKKIELIFKALLEDLINKIYIRVLELLKISFVIVILSFIVDVFNLRKLLISTKDYLLSNQDLSKILLGSFLASALGILTQTYIKRINSKAETRKYSRLLLSDLTKIVQDSLIYRVMLEDPKLKNPDILYGSVIGKMYFDSNWRNYYSYLINELDSHYYDKIVSIYINVDKFNKALDKLDSKLIIQSLNQINPKYNTSKYLGFPEITNQKLLDALKRLSKSKKVKSYIIPNLIGELLYIKKKNRIFSVIENYVCMLLKNNEILKQNEIENLVKNEPSLSKYIKENSKVIDRIIFDVLCSSSMIKSDWGEYSLKQ